MSELEKDPLPPDPIAAIEAALEDLIRLLREAGEAVWLPRWEKTRERFRALDLSYDICQEIQGVLHQGDKPFTDFSLTNETAPNLTDEKIKNYQPTIEKLKKTIDQFSQAVVKMGPIA